MFAYAKPEQKKASKDVVQKKDIAQKKVTEKVASSPNATGIPSVMKARFENSSGFSFDDVRVHQSSGKPAQLQGETILNHNAPIQFARKLRITERKPKFKTIGDASSKLSLKDNSDEGRRAARAAKLFKLATGRKVSGRNLLYVTILVGNGSKKRKRTFHLVSAGLGGKFPRYLGKSASHTEQIWRGLWRSGVIAKHLRQNKAKLVVKSVYSRYQACDKNSSMERGCSSIPLEEMGMSPTTPFYYSCAYSTGGEKESISLAGMESLGTGDREPDSEDDFIDTEKLRDFDIEEITLGEFDKIVTHNPKLC